MRMRINLAALALVTGLTGLSYAQAPAGGGAPQTAAQPAAAPTRIGVIDIGFIFDHHPTMKPQMDAIEAQIKAAEDEINNRRVAMMKEVESLRQFQENSPEFKKKEEFLANEESKLKLDFVRKEKQFQLDKAKVVYETYKQVEIMTKQVAEANQFAMIMRYSRTDMDPTKPATVQGGINKDVVYFNPGFDLTEYVLDQIKRQTPATAAPAASTSAARPGVNSLAPDARNAAAPGGNRK